MTDYCSLIKLAKREEIQIDKVRNKKGDITTDSKEIQRPIRDYFQNSIPIN